MREEDLYKFCPKCGAKTLLKGKIEGLLCYSCNFEFFLPPSPTCMVVIINQNREILLTKRGREPDKGWWDFPGGFIEKGESVEKGIAREMKEELGIEVKVEQYFHSNPMDYQYKDLNIELLDLTFICSYTGNPKPADDVVDFGFFSKDNYLKK